GEPSRARRALPAQPKPHVCEPGCDLSRHRHRRAIPLGAPAAAGGADDHPAPRDRARGGVPRAPLRRPLSRLQSARPALALSRNPRRVAGSQMSGLWMRGGLTPAESRCSLAAKPLERLSKPQSVLACARLRPVATVSPPSSRLTAQLSPRLPDLV